MSALTITSDKKTVFLKYKNISRRRNPTVLPLLLHSALTDRTSASVTLHCQETLSRYNGRTHRSLYRPLPIVGALLRSHLQSFSLHPSQHPHTPARHRPQVWFWTSEAKHTSSGSLGILCKTSKNLLSSSLPFSFIVHVQNPIIHLVGLSSMVFTITIVQSSITHLPPAENQACPKILHVFHTFCIYI